MMHSRVLIEGVIASRPPALLTFLTAAIVVSAAQAGKTTLALPSMSAQTRAPQEITSLLHSHFYRIWMAAQHAKGKGRERPFYWASFIQSGEWTKPGGQR